jgi:hypothetical protein
VRWPEWLVAEVLAPVSHHQWVFTVPKRLPLLFLYDRLLLGALSRCAGNTVCDLCRAGGSTRRAGDRGVDTDVRDPANWQPHLQAPVSEGAFDRHGELTPLEMPPAGVAEQLFRPRVTRMLVWRGRLEQDVAAGSISWKHS